MFFCFEINIGGVFGSIIMKEFIDKGLFVTVKGNILLPLSKKYRKELIKTYFSIKRSAGKRSRMETLI